MTPYAFIESHTAALQKNLDSVWSESVDLLCVAAALTVILTAKTVELFYKAYILEGVSSVSALNQSHIKMHLFPPDFSVSQ